MVPGDPADEGGTWGDGLNDGSGASADDQLADALAAFDEALAAGEAPAPNLADGVDPALRPELIQAQSIVWLLERAWPRLPGSVAEVPHAEAGAGASTSFGRFRVERTLGQGGFGIVLLAWDPALRRKVALKIPQPEALVVPGVRERFLREAHAAAALDHPNIVPVYEVGAVGAVSYIASAYCEGTNLADWLETRDGPVHPHDAARLVVTVAGAVQHAHDRGVLHRDIKPRNVLLQAAPSGVEIPEPAARSGLDPDLAPGARELAEFTPRLTDFGLARVRDLEGELTKSGVPIGSPPYMSPEQAQGRSRSIGPPTDVYALGCVLYELLCGQAPFSGETALETLHKVIRAEPTPPRRLRSDLTRDLEAICLKCLSKEVVSRYPDAKSLAEDLERYLSGRPTKARPLGPWARGRRWVWRHRVAAIVLMVAALAGAGVWGLLRANRNWLEQVRSLVLREAEQRKQVEDRLDQARVVALREVERRARAEEVSRRQKYVLTIREAEKALADEVHERLERLLSSLIPRPGAPDLRDFAWYYLYRRLHTERHTFSGHVGAVYHAEFSPDGTLLASAGQDGTVRLWKAGAWRLVRTIQAHTSETNWARFSRDGKTLATTGDDGTVRLWDVATGRHLKTLNAYPKNATIALFTPDGKSLVTSDHDTGTVKIWDLASGTEQGQFRAKKGQFPMENMALSADGTLLATVVTHEPAKVWDLPRRKLLAQLEGTGPFAVAFSHDGTMLATEGPDHAIISWEVPSGRRRREFARHDRHRHDIVSLAFSSDDQRLVSAGRDRTVRLWDVETGTLLATHTGHNGRIWDANFSPDGKTIVSAGGDGELKTWDPETRGPWAELFTIKPEFKGNWRSSVFAFDVYRRPIALGSSLQSMLWEQDHGESAYHWVKLWAPGIIYLAADVSADGRKLVSLDAVGLMLVRDITDLGLGQTVARSRYPPGIDISRMQGKKGWLVAHDLSGVQSDPTGRLVAIERGEGSQAVLWDVERSTFRPLGPGAYQSSPLALGPNGRIIVLSRTLDREGKHHDTCHIINNAFDSLALSAPRDDLVGLLGGFSSDGAVLAGRIDGVNSIKVWTGQGLTFRGEIDYGQHEAARLNAAIPSPDGKLVASLDDEGRVKLWDISTLQELLTVEGLHPGYDALRFSPDGLSLAVWPRRGAEDFGWVVLEGERPSDLKALP